MCESEPDSTLKKQKDPGIDPCIIHISLEFQTTKPSDLSCRINLQMRGLLDYYRKYDPNAVKGFLQEVIFV
jgi:hypothetical protein